MYIFSEISIQPTSISLFDTCFVLCVLFVCVGFFFFFVGGGGWGVWRIGYQVFAVYECI